MKIAIDLDGPIRLLMKKLVEVYNRERGDNFTLEQITEYDIGRCFPIGDEIYEMLFETHAQEIYLGAEVETGAKEAIAELAEYNEVFILTDQPTEETKHYSAVWLRQNGFEGIQVTFCQGRPKHEFEFDLLIDDWPKHLDGAKAVGRKVICYGKPWNKSNWNWEDILFSVRFTEGT